MTKEQKKKLAEERGNRMAKRKEELTRKAPYISTGSTMLDLSLGGGDALAKGGMGTKVGDILNIAGDSSSGKSFLACEIIANAKRDVESGKLLEHGISKFKWVYNDIESGYNFDSMALWGFEIQSSEKSERFRTPTIEKFSSHIQLELQKLKDDELMVYVVDSWDALSSDVMLKRNDERLTKHKKDEEFTKGSMMMDKQKFVSVELFNPIQSLMEKKNCVLVLVSQLRQNVNAGQFDKQWRISGEGVMKYFCDTRVLIKSKVVENGEYVDDITGVKHTRWIGSTVQATPLKTRHSRPCREICYDVRFDYGVDDLGSCVDFLYDLREEKTYKIRTVDRVKNLSFPPKPAGEYQKANLVNIRAWLKEKLPEAGVKTTTPKDELTQLVLDNNLKKEYEETFGSGLDRQGMMDYIFDNDLREPFLQAVIDKWEKIESQFKTTKRWSKF